MTPLHDSQDVQLDIFQGETPVDQMPDTDLAENGVDEHGEILPNLPPGSYDPATVDIPYCEAMIERTRLKGNPLATWIKEWSALRPDGWDVTVLLDRMDGSLVGMASRIVRA